MIRPFPLVAALVLALPLGAAAADKPRYEYDSAAEKPKDPEPRRLEAQGVGDNEARRLLKKYEKEPGIREAQLAAIRYAEIDPERIESWRTRAGVAAIAPEVTGEYRRLLQNDRVLGSQITKNVDYSGLREDDRYVVRARWDLDELIFNPDELRVASETTDLVKLRENVVEDVTKLYFERRRLQVELDTAPPAELTARMKKELRLQELTASIDGVTGGWFSRELKEKGLAAY